MAVRKAFLNWDSKIRSEYVGGRLSAPFGPKADDFSAFDFKADATQQGNLVALSLFDLDHGFRLY